MRTRFEVDGQYLDVWFTDPWTEEQEHRRYWVPLDGGYVRVDFPPFSRPGTLGGQPPTDGVTWWARDVAHVKRLFQNFLRRDRRAAKEY